MWRGGGGASLEGDGRAVGRDAMNQSGGAEGGEAPGGVGGNGGNFTMALGKVGRGR